MSPTLPTPGAWPTDEELLPWYKDYLRWAHTRDQQFDLEDLREHLWNVAANRKTVTAQKVMDRFHLARGSGLRAIGYVVELVSEFNRIVILNELPVCLSAMVVTSDSIDGPGGPYPLGLPLPGFYDDPKHVTDADRKEAAMYQVATWDHCQSHPFKRWP